MGREIMTLRIQCEVHVCVGVEDTHPRYTISLVVAGISPKEEDDNVYYIVKGT
jgi:hypothetical protein